MALITLEIASECLFSLDVSLWLLNITYAMLKANTNISANLDMFPRNSQYSKAQVPISAKGSLLMHTALYVTMKVENNSLF